MSLKAKKVLSLLASVMCMLPLYVVLHKGGHALVAVLCGARVTSFSVAAASMSYQGGRFTALTLSLFHAAGVLLPVLAAVVYMLTYWRQTKSVCYCIVSFMVLLMPMGSILAWVIVPVLSLMGSAPRDDDAAKFIDSSGLSPWAVLLGAVLLLACCLWIAWRKKIPQNYWSALTRDKQAIPSCARGRLASTGPPPAE